jgi:MFS family permease
MESQVQEQPARASNSASLPITEEPTTQPELTPEELRAQRRLLIIIVVFSIVLVAAIIALAFFFLSPETDTAKWRDVFIIFMALEFLVIGLTLVILIIQLARLINLLQNEVKPILESTNETVSTLRGTATFLSDNLAQPVVKVNSYVAAARRLLELIGLNR